MSGGKIVIIKKKVAGHAHHGGAWKVAYADFVTAMMALFMVLWLLSQTDQDSREKISEYFRTGVFTGSASVLSGGMGIVDKGWVDIENPKTIDESSLYRQARMVAEAMEEAFLAMEKPGTDQGSVSDHVKVSVTNDGLLIQLIDGEEALLFDSSSAELKPAAIEFLSKLSPILANIQNKLQIHGHTDARPFPEGAKTTNWELSFRRANAARELMLKNGIPANRIVGVFAHAEHSPLKGYDPKSPANRRLAILAVRKGAEKAAAGGVPLGPDGQPEPIDEVEPAEAAGAPLPSSEAPSPAASTPAEQGAAPRDKPEEAKPPAK